MKNKDIKKRALALVSKYYDAAKEQCRLKGFKPDLENIMIQMIDLHYKRKNVLK
jgi:hypothetical protein